MFLKNSFSRTLLPNLGFSSGSAGKEPSCQSRRCKRHRFSLWVRNIPPRGGNSNQHQYSCLGNPTDRKGLLSLGLQRIQHNWANLCADAPAAPGRPVLTHAISFNPDLWAAYRPQSDWPLAPGSPRNNYQTLRVDFILPSESALFSK